MSLATADIANLVADDIIIVLMGPTGSGKSNLIDKLTRQKTNWSGHSLRSCTEKVLVIRIYNHPSKGNRIVLVDTPGFDNTSISDMEVLRMIGKWLANTYERNITLAGIIYLHRISDNRMSGSSLKDLRMFAELCGTEAANGVTFVTTHWDKIKPDLAQSRQQQLIEKYWEPMISLGATTNKFYNTKESAENIIAPLLEKEDRNILLLQEELVDLHKALHETKTGQTLYTTLQTILADQKETLRLLAEQCSGGNNPALERELQDNLDKARADFNETFSDVKELKVPFGKRTALALLTFSRKHEAHRRTVEIPTS